MRRFTAKLVVDPILPRHHRIEAFRVEIAIVDLVPLRAQDLDDLRVQGGGETRLDRMGEQHQDAQRRSALRRARPRFKPWEKEVFAGGEIKFRILPGDHFARIEQSAGIRFAFERQLDCVGLLHAAFL